MRFFAFSKKTGGSLTPMGLISNLINEKLEIWILLFGFIVLFSFQSIYSTENRIVLMPLIDAEGIKKEDSSSATQSLKKSLENSNIIIYLYENKENDNKFRGKNELKKIAKDLNYDFILSGSLRKIDTSYYLFLYLFSASNDPDKETILECDSPDCKNFSEEKLFADLSITSKSGIHSYFDPLVVPVKKDDVPYIHEYIQNSFPRFGAITRSILIPGWGQANEEKRGKGIIFFLSVSFFVSMWDEQSDSAIHDTRTRNSYIGYYYVLNNTPAQVVSANLYHYMDNTIRIEKRDRDLYKNIATFIYAINLLDIIFNEKDFESRLKLTSDYKREKTFQGGMDESITFTLQFSF